MSDYLNMMRNMSRRYCTTVRSPEIRQKNGQIGQPSDLNCPTKHLLQKSIYPTFGHKLSESIEKIVELFPVITQFIFTIQYALVSLGKDFLVLELQWVIEFKKIPRLFYKTLSHIYGKKIHKKDGN